MCLRVCVCVDVRACTHSGVIPPAIAEAVNSGEVVPVAPYMSDMQYSRTRLLLRPEKVVAKKPKGRRGRRPTAEASEEATGAAGGSTPGPAAPASRTNSGAGAAGPSSGQEAAKRGRGEDLITLETVRMMAPVRGVVCV